jgi:hypothetical protein
MRRQLAIVLIALSAALAVPSPASAGGPTSVLITDPALGRATALYYTDARYEDLDVLLAGGMRLEGQPPGLGGRSVNLTWMVHDVQPWRTQQLHLDAGGGPVVATYGAEALGDDGQVTWSRIADGDGLAAALERILRPRVTPAAAEVEAPASNAGVSARRVPETEATWYTLAGWRWLVPGLLVGAGLALLASRRPDGDAEPRQQLTDLTPGDELSAQR